MKNSSKLSLRRWNENDAMFVCRLRNDPKLMRWYRQENPIGLEDQKQFIKHDLFYNGQIIELNKKPIGVIAFQNSFELSLVLPEKYHKIIPRLLRKRLWWGEVFIKNPILIYLLKAGGKTLGVNERAYYKKGIGLIDTIIVGTHESFNNFTER